MKIKVLGSDGKNFETLTNNTKAALKEIRREAEIEEATDFAEIAKYGVMSTPALVINERVVSFGKVLKPKEIIKIIEKAGL